GQKTLRLGYNRHAIGFLSIKCANSILQDSIRFSILVGKSHINCNSTLTEKIAKIFNTIYKENSVQYCIVLIQMHNKVNYESLLR
ncbi:MAG: hypothetical protein VB009_00620, partial [Erysipelotrichaceae bacterium]|nr:hypothetical protein [Erysipelotrichaceae bacterium]